jgi:hypothetical protein
VKAVASHRNPYGRSAQKFVIPAQAGIQTRWREVLDSRLRGNDGVGFIKKIT